MNATSAACSFLSLRGLWVRAPSARSIIGAKRIARTNQLPPPTVLAQRLGQAMNLPQSPGLARFRGLAGVHVEELLVHSRRPTDYRGLRRGTLEQSRFDELV